MRRLQAVVSNALGQFDFSSNYTFATGAKKKGPVDPCANACRIDSRGRQVDPSGCDACLLTNLPALQAYVNRSMFNPLRFPPATALQYRTPSLVSSYYTNSALYGCY